MNYWIVKQEPESYSWADFLRDGGTVWTGVRNFQARNHLRAMQMDDVVLFYHSGEEKQIVGWARVTKKAYPDPTADEGDWVCVDLKPVKPLAKPVTLAAIKKESACQDMPLVRNSRLSVSPVTKPQFDRLMAMSL